MTERSATSSEASALVIAAGDKAGMEGIDRTKIDEIILRESGDSAYMKQQRKRDQSVNEKIDQMRVKLEEKDRASSNWRRSIESELEPELRRLMASRKRRSTCVVVDMDMFYFACEALTRPELKDKPACVGGGMILTSNYCARKFGVRSAMAGWIGDKLVSELSAGKERLIHVPSNFHLYTEKSLQVRHVLAQYDPGLKAYSLDEAYLDLGPYVALSLKGFTHEQIQNELKKANEVSDDDADHLVVELEDEAHGLLGDESLDAFPQSVAIEATASIVRKMREQVCEATGGLTCSAGVANNFMLAKIASDRNKPDGQCVVGPFHEDVLNFLHPLPTRKVPGIGRVTEKTLHAFGIATVEDLYTNRALVNFLFKPATGGFLLRASVGCTCSHESNEGNSGGRKGISRERTFQSGRPWTEVNTRLEDIARKLSDDMSIKNLWAQTTTVKVKLDTFDVLSRSKTVKGMYLQKPEDLAKLASEMLHDLKKEHKGTSFSVRLLGVRCSNFQGEEQRLDSTQTSIQKFLTTNNESNEKSLSNNVSSANTPPCPAPRRVPPKKETPRMDSIQPPSPHMIQVCCPMCQQPIEGGNDNVVLNRHIDSCLNSSTVRAAVKEESVAARQSKKPRLTDFFGKK
jgi:DNA polymerase kappa